MNSKPPKDGRIQQIFDQQTQLRVDFLCTATETTCEAEAIRNALTVYEWFLDAIHQGEQIYLFDKSGKRVLVELPDSDDDIHTSKRIRQSVYRKQFKFNETVHQRIEHIKKLTETKTNSSVIRGAIKLHTLLIASILADNKIQLRDEKDNWSLVVFPVSKFVRPDISSLQSLGLSSHAP